MVESGDSVVQVMIYAVEVMTTALESAGFVLK